MRPCLSANHAAARNQAPFPQPITSTTYTHTHSPRSLPLFFLPGFILSQILFWRAGTRPRPSPSPSSPEAEVGNHSSVRARRFAFFFLFFLFGPKLLRLYLWGLSRHAIVCHSFIHKVHNDEGRRWAVGWVGGGESHNAAAPHYLFRRCCLFSSSDHKCHNFTATF